MTNGAGPLPVWAVVLGVAAVAPFAARWLATYLDGRARRATVRQLQLAEKASRPH